MDDFVRGKLAEWGLSCLDHIFEENMIDSESLLLLQPPELKEMVPMVGPRTKLLKNLRQLQETDTEWVTYASPVSFNLAELEDGEEEDSAAGHYTSTSNSPPVHQAKRQRTSKMFSVREVLQNTQDGHHIMEELSQEAPSVKARRKMVQILVSWLVEVYGDRPSREAKTELAKGIVAEFPNLKDSVGEGHEAYYTPGSTGHSASGFLEMRLRNMRRRSFVMPSKQKVTSAVQHPQAPVPRVQPPPGEWVECDHPDHSSKSPPVHQAMRQRTSKMFSVREVLQNTQDGQNIMEELSQEAPSVKARRKMVQLLVSWLVEVYGDRPSREAKTELAKGIVAEFPNLKDSVGEGHEAYYTPGSTGHSASGFLEMRLRNMRRRSFVMPSKQKVTSAVQHPQAPIPRVQPPPEDNLSEAEATAMIAWLKSNRQPETQVREYMKKTAPNRLKLLQESTEQLGSVLLEYPRLLDTPGMIEQDFSVLYPSNAPRLYEMWSNKSKKILKWADQQASSWKKYVQIPDELTEDQADLAAFHVLPYVLPTGVHLSTEGKRTKYSKAEAALAFVDVQPVGTNIPQYLRLLEADLKDNGEKALRKKPFVLVLGNILSPTQAFLMAERLAIPHGSTIAAIDACFKAFYVLNVEYPVACRNVWRFLQHGCYQVEGGEREIVPTVRSLITAVCKE